jgi:hypothetical protein
MRKPLMTIENVAYFVVGLFIGHIIVMVLGALT